MIGRVLREGIDYVTRRSSATHAVTCRGCGFSIDVPGADTAEAVLAKAQEHKHDCGAVDLVASPYRCERCGDVTAHKDLGSISLNGISVTICPDCRRRQAFDR